MTTTTRMIGLAVIAVCAGGLSAGEMKLANPKRVFPTTQPAYKSPTQHHAFAMRLSPGGKLLLYSRPAAGSEQADERSARYELVLRELEGGKEAVLPIESVDLGWRTVALRFNFFDPAGNRLALPTIKVETRQIDVRMSSTKSSIKWLIYDIAAGKVTSNGIDGSAGPAKFTADGQGLFTSGGRQMSTRIISLKDPNAEPKTLAAPGWLQSVCPSGDVAVFFVPPGRPAGPPQPGERMQRPPIRLVLWDLKADKELALLPTHPSNSELDDRETQWTADGRYLYYTDADVEQAAADGRANPSFRRVTRVWDRQAGKPAGQITDAVPVGPWTSSSLMVLAKQTGSDSGGFLVHDAASGREYTIGDDSKHLIHAYGGKVVYAQTPDGADGEVVFVADLVPSKPSE